MPLCANNAILVKNFCFFLFFFIYVFKKKCIFVADSLCVARN